MIVGIGNVFPDGTPEHLDVCKLYRDIEDMPGVAFVEDVHVRTINSKVVAFTVRVLTNPNYPGGRDELPGSIKNFSHDNFCITRATIQGDESALNCKEDHHMDALVSQFHPGSVGRRWFPIWP